MAAMTVVKGTSETRASEPREASAPVPASCGQSHAAPRRAPAGLMSHLSVAGTQEAVQGIREAKWVLKNLAPLHARAELEDADVSGLARCLQRWRLERGTVLFAEGKTPAGVWMIIEGAVELVVKAGRARRVIQIYRAGEAVGDAYLLLDEASSCNARTLEHTTCFFLPAKSFLQLIHHHPSLRTLWLYNLATRVLQGHTRLAEVLAGSLAERVARVLIEEADEGIVRLPQRTLAEMLGVQRTSVNKVLKDFESKGLVELMYGQTLVKGHEQLMSIANNGIALMPVLLYSKNEKKSKRSYAPPPVQHRVEVVAGGAGAGHARKDLRGHKGRGRPLPA